MEVTENSCLVLTSGGIGYELFIPGHSLGRLPQRGEELVFYVHTNVREDAIELFGFESWDERETFQTLIGINRVGARTALAILTIFRPDDLRQLVIDDDVFGLAQVSGIGKKSAQQIFLDLKYKLKLESVPGKGPNASGASGLFKDAIVGLSNLGYAEDEAAFVVKEVLAAEPDLDDVGAILRSALKRMARRA